MTQRPLITEEMRQAIGVESAPYTFEVEKGDIIRYAQAIGDPNPTFRDEVAARRSRYGGIIVPPTYLIVMRIFEAAAFRERLALRSPLGRSVDGGSVWTYFEPIRPGDRLTATAKVVGLYEREGRWDRMIFRIIEITYVNQFGQVVAKQRDTAIFY